MKKLNYFFIFLGCFIGLSFLGSFNLYADGCYICGSGSSSNCKDYCRYSGSDTFENRKKCEKAGCKVSGTASCPTAVNYKICSAFTEQNLIERLVSFYKIELR